MAEWWRRVGASLVDWIVLVVIAVALSFVLRSWFIWFLGGFAATGVYYVVLLGQPRGQTLGNRAAATMVCDATSLGPVSTRQAVIRWLAQWVPIYLVLTFGLLLSAIFVIYLIVDFLMPLWDPKDQTLHDKLAGTLVTRVPATLPPL